MPTIFVITYLAPDTDVKYTTWKTKSVVTVTTVVRVVTRRMEGCLFWNISEGGDTSVDYSLPVHELDVPAHVGEVEVQGRVLVEANGHGPWVSALDLVTLVLRPVTIHISVLVRHKHSFL